MCWSVLFPSVGNVQEHGANAAPIAKSVSGMQAEISAVTAQMDVHPEHGQLSGTSSLRGEILNLQLLTRAPPNVGRLDGEVKRFGELPVARGHYSDIWLGEWFRKEKVALKCLRDVRATDPKVLKRCQQEFSTRKYLQNDHILPLYGVVTDLHHHIYMVSPWQANGSFLEFVKSRPTTNKLQLLLGAARGLHYLHILGFVHGDVKCSNILVSSNGGALVSGFRLSKLLEDVTMKSASAGISAAESARWLAPELIEGSISSPTVHSDTYSFAMTILELLTENHPFANLKRDAAVIHEVVVKKKKPLRPPVDEVKPWLTDQLWALMQECWRYDAMDRPVMSEVAYRLQEIEFAIGANRHPNATTVNGLTIIAPASALPVNEESPSARAGESLTSPYGDGLRPFSSEDVIIAIMGPVGTGKRSFINVATANHSTNIGRDLESCAQDIHAISCPHPDGSGRNVVFLDTSGFDNSETTDYDILRAIALWLKKTHRGRVTLTGILLFHRISEIRFRGIPFKNSRMLRELCGAGALRNVILITTMWDEVPEEIGLKREAYLRAALWKPMMSRGCRMARFSSTFESAWEIIDKFHFDTRRPIKLQNEMVDDGTELHQTSSFADLLQRSQKLIARFRQKRDAQPMLSTKDIKPPNLTINQKRRLDTNKHSEPSTRLSRLAKFHERFRTPLLEQVTSPVDHGRLNSRQARVSSSSHNNETNDHAPMQDHKQVHSPDFEGLAHSSNAFTMIDSYHPKVYQNLLSAIYHALRAKEGSVTAISDTLESILEPMRNQGAVFSLMNSQRYCTQLLEVSSKLGLNDRIIHQALSEDDLILCNIAQAILDSDQDKKIVLTLRGDDAERFMTAMQIILDKASFQSLANGTSARGRRLLVKLSEESDILPSSLSINGVTITDTEAVNGGGFADIFRGQYMGQEVALKRLRLFHNSPQARHKLNRALCREALVWTQLRHPHVLSFLGVDAHTFPGFLCMVSPWMPHGTLSKFLEEPNALYANFNVLLFEIAQGAEYLHSQNIVHGDLRGGNILVDNQCRPCLADFGLVAFAETTTAGSRSTNHQGSIRWMAPELHYPEKFGLQMFRRTRASDVYAFACVCIEVYSGRPPFSELKNDSAVVYQVVQGALPERPSKECRRSMSDEMWHLVESCLRPQFSMRPTMDEVTRMLMKGNFGVVAP